MSLHNVRRWTWDVDNDDRVLLKELVRLARLTLRIMHPLVDSVFDVFARHWIHHESAEVADEVRLEV